MMRWLASARHLWRHPWQAGLAILGVALGVAVVIAIDLANASASRAFTLSAQTLSGKATHQIIGGPTGIPEAVYVRLRREQGLRTAVPVVEAYGKAADFAGVTFHVIGTDPFAGGLFDVDIAGDQHSERLMRLLIEPATALISATTVAQLRLQVGDRLALDLGGRRQTLTLVGLLEPNDAAQARALERVLLTDIATAQELIGRPDFLSRIDLVLSATEAVALARTLPPGLELAPAAGRNQALEQMTRAFKLNLLALSLLVLVVGMFLIYNTMTFSVVQRRAHIGTLRALGVTRREVFTLIVSEALAIGVIGTIFGVGLGILLADGLTQLVTRTINDLYFVVAVRELTISPASLAKGIALGLGATIAAALVPAWEATRAPASSVLRRSTLETQHHRATPRLALLGLCAWLLGTLLLAWPTRSLPLSYAALFSVILGAALIAPLATLGLMRALTPVMASAGGLLGRMATRNVTATLSRTGVAVSALAVAVAATVGVGIMITSFRTSFTYWLDHTFRADLYISAPAVNAGAGNVPLETQLVQRLISTPGVGEVTTGRYVHLQTARGTTELFAVDTTQARFRYFDFKAGDADAIWPAFEHGEAVIVSEPYAYHHRLKPGDRLRLRTAMGERAFTVAGIYADFGSDQGVVAMSRHTYDRFWHDPSITSLAVYAQPGVDLDALQRALEARAGTQQALVIRSNRGLREASLEIFDRTFAITEVLRVLATLVAFVGILSALMALQLERARPLAVLRANGLTSAQLWGLVTTETGLMGLAAGLLAVPLGLLLATLLIVVINRRSFGWSMAVTIDPAILVQGLLLAVAAALLAGLYPAYRMARTSPALALREE
jgi:putative ABC transport system permease protein